MKIIPVLILFLYLSFSIQGANALKMPDMYKNDECERAAKDFQKKFGGSLVWIAPKNWDTGAWILGEYSAHLINKVYVRGNDKYFYIDYSYQRILQNKSAVLEYYRYEIGGYDAEIFDLGQGERPPYAMIWHT